MIRRPPRSTQSRSSAASDVYKRQGLHGVEDDVDEHLFDLLGIDPQSLRRVLALDGKCHAGPVGLWTEEAHHTTNDLRQIRRKKPRRPGPGVVEELLDQPLEAVKFARRD